MNAILIIGQGKIEAIKAEIECAKLDNMQMIHSSNDPHRLNYPPEWFYGKADEITKIVNIILDYEKDKSRTEAIRKFFV